MLIDQAQELLQQRFIFLFSPSTATESTATPSTARQTSLSLSLSVDLVAWITPPSLPGTLRAVRKACSIAKVLFSTSFSEPRDSCAGSVPPYRRGCPGVGWGTEAGKSSRKPQPQSE